MHVQNYDVCLFSLSPPILSALKAVINSTKLKEQEPILDFFLDVFFAFSDTSCSLLYIPS
jgi:hypothetical protein